MLHYKHRCTRSTECVLVCLPRASHPSVSRGASSTPLDTEDPKGLGPLQRIAMYESRLTSKARPLGAMPISSLFATQKTKPSSANSKTFWSVKRPASCSASRKGGGSGRVQPHPPVVQVVREPAASHLLQEGVESRSPSVKDRIISNITSMR